MASKLKERKVSWKFFLRAGAKSTLGGGLGARYWQNLAQSVAESGPFKLWFCGV